LKTFYINPLSGDLEFDGLRRFKMVSEDDAIAQDIWVILSTNLGEWFLNTEMGFDRFAVLGQKNFSESQVIDEVTRAVMQHPKIETVNNVTIRFDREKRKLHYTFTAVKMDGATIERGGTI